MEEALTIAQFQSNALELLKKLGLPRDEIPSSRRYWFVRTQAGSLYEEFLVDGFIAIGWDKAPCFKQDQEFTEQAIKQVEKEYEAKSGTRILNQVRRFCYEMKKGDVVVIPSKSSATLAFGIVEGNIYNVESPSEEAIEDGWCPYTRRRTVKWLTGLPRQRIDTKLYEIFRSHHALSSADNLAPFIDRVVSPFYLKDGITHLTMSLGSEESPFYEDIITLLGGISFITSQILNEYKLPFEDDFLRMRINVQSKGNFELFSNGTKILIAGLVIMFLCGGTFSGGFDISKGEAHVAAKTGGLPYLIETIHKVVSEIPKDHPYSEDKLRHAASRTELGETTDETAEQEECSAVDHDTDRSSAE